MRLIRICKSGESVVQGQCPAIYEAPERPDAMVGQGKRLDAATAAELQDLADDESAVMIPAETILRAAGLYLTARGRPAVMTEVQAYLDQEGARE